MEIISKYGMSIKQEDFRVYANGLKNKVYKLLPLREEGLEWEKYLNTILIEVSGSYELLPFKSDLISLLSKLEGLYKVEEFMSYRRTIFECLSLIEDLG